MFIRDDKFNTKWQLYRTDTNGEMHYSVWQEFLAKLALQKSILDTNDELVRAPVWIEKRFGINNKRLSHVSVTFGKDYLTETTLENSHETAKINALDKEQLKIELEAWTPRNLNILLLEFLVDYEMAALQNLASTQLKSLISDIEINEKKHFEHLYKHILAVINDAHFECYEATDTHTINIAHIPKYDFDEEFKVLKFHYIPLLQLLTSAEQFLQLKIALQSTEYYALDYRGTTIDRTFIDSILHPDSHAPEPGLPVIASPEKPKSTTEISQRSLGYKIGIAIAIGSLLGLLTLGIATAIIFTGGTAALLGAATIAAILVTSFITPVFGSFITGLSIGLSDKAELKNSTTQFINDQLSHNPTRGEVVHATPPSITQTETNLAIIKSQPPLDAPCAQNPSPPLAPTPSVTPH